MNKSQLAKTVDKILKQHQFFFGVKDGSMTRPRQRVLENIFAPLLIFLLDSGQGDKLLSTQHLESAIIESLSANPTLDLDPSIKSELTSYRGPVNWFDESLKISLNSDHPLKKLVSKVVESMSATAKKEYAKYALEYA